MPRLDQRRWGEVYVRGLAEVSGRKSVRRISEYVLGRRADQSLQQFVNQSSWEWEPVRRQLAEEAAAILSPWAWVVEEAVLPKNGDSSVGVDRQYSQAAGRVLNCQLGLALMVCGQAGAMPVNWRLLLPRSWDTDERRRSRSRVPDHERHRPRWHSLFDMVDEMTVGWGMKPPPVVVDARRHLSVHTLIGGLESRSLRYAVRVAPTTPVGLGPSGRLVTAVEALAGTADVRKDSGHRQDTRIMGRTVATALLPNSAVPCGVAGGCHAHGTRQVMAERTRDRSGPDSAWITNMDEVGSTSALELTLLRAHAGRELEQLSEESGLRHFEGRSYRGWHHHVTLVSAAHAYRLSRRIEPAGVKPVRQPSLCP